MRASWVLLALLVLAGCTGPDVASPKAPATLPEPEPEVLPREMVRFSDCYGWLFNELMPFDVARGLVPPTFTPERAGPAGVGFPPGRPHDANAGRKIFWALRCASGAVGNSTFQDVGYLYACIPSIPVEGEWGAGFKRHYLAIELGVSPPAMAKAINETTGLRVTPGETSTGPADVKGNGIHEWTFKAADWTFILDSRMQNPLPAVYRYETQDVTALWTTDGNASSRANRASHGGYGNERYPANPRFEGNTAAKRIFTENEEVWVANSIAFTGEVSGARDSWTPELRYRTNVTWAPKP